MFPLITAMSLRKKKNLTNQESMRAAMMGYVGSAIPGAAGAVLSTMSAANEESLKNRLEVAEASQANSAGDLAVLLNKDRACICLKTRTVTIKIDDNARAVLIRQGLITEAGTTASVQAATFERFAEIVSELADKVDKIAGTKSTSSISKPTPPTTKGGGGGTSPTGGTTPP